MKRGLLVLLFAFVVIHLFATHYRGGEITYKFIGPLTLEATVTTYTKVSYPSNLADQDSVSFNWGDGHTSVLPRINGLNDGSCNGPYPCGAVVGTDIKQSIYQGIHTFAGPPSNSDYYIISFVADNLLGGIANIDNGSSVNVPFFVSDSIYMGNDFNQGPGNYDASPVFLNPLKYYAFVSEPFTFNSAAFDPDGDSLSYTLLVPKADENDEVPFYVYPYLYCRTEAGQPNNTFVVNTQTGEIKWTTPCAQGFYQAELEVREYRCGLFIGSVVRNMQIIVLPGPNPMPQLSIQHDTIIQPGQLLEYNISSHDSSFSNIDSIQVLGEPFLDTNSIHRPVFQGVMGNPATGTFTWQPDSLFANSSGYLFTVISSDNFTAIGPNGTAPYPGTDMETFRVWVADAAPPCMLTSIDNTTVSSARINIFPNPVNDVLHIQASEPILNVSVSDLSGRQVLNIKTNNLSYDLDASRFDNGAYLLSIGIKDLTITRKFLKIEGK